MATTATRNGNSLYIEASGGASTLDALTSKGVTVCEIILTAGAAAETLTLADVTTNTTKTVIKAAAATTIHIPLANPMGFPNGIRVTLTQTDSHATLVIKESRS